MRSSWNPFRLLIVATLSAPIAFFAAITNSLAKEEPPAASPGNAGMISAPITYEGLMLIAVTSDGVAAFRFQEEIKRGVKYEFRYIEPGESEEVTGHGTVFEAQHPDGDDYLRAGPIKVGWSAGAAGKGWVYYEPEKLCLQIASANRFDGYFMTGQFPQDVTKVEPLDLKRFLKQP